MSTKGDRGCETATGMTRGEFLGAGAAVAAAASVGGVAPLAAESGSEQVQAVCQPACGGPWHPWAQRWAIPAGILNALWSDIFPRLMARRWAHEASAAGAAAADDVKPGMTIDQLHAAVSDLWMATPNPTAEFTRRVQLVLTYLDPMAADAASRIPIHIVGEGGFDFILSDQGLELFMPLRPTDVADLARYYAFRNTGRRANGLPDYLRDEVSGISTDSPTGPSQVFVHAPEVRAVLTTVPGPCSQRIQACLQEHEADEEDLRVADGEVTIQSRLTPGRKLHLGIETYLGIMSSTRCWHLSGSVFRGIQVELPRVVATCWYEEATSMQSITNDLYSVRFDNPANDGLRQIFQERLETALHGDHRMVFRSVRVNAAQGQIQSLDANGNALVDANNQPIWRARPSKWPAAGDVMVTNQGVYLPSYPPKTPASDLVAMLETIRDGKAGNPVFTDSMHTV